MISGSNFCSTRQQERLRPLDFIPLVMETLLNLVININSFTLLLQKSW